MGRDNQATERFSGTFTAIPHAVQDSVAFRWASHRAQALLLELARQLNGKNNGRLQLSVKWLKGRGWTSTDVIQKAKREILERGLAEKTRLGGLGVGPDRYAVTWLPILDYSGLDMKRGEFRQGQWRMLDTPPPIGRRVAQSAARNGPAPPHGTGTLSHVPQHGTLTPDLPPLPVPPHGNNVVASSRSRKASRVVGRSGRSGIRKVDQPATPPRESVADPIAEVQP